MARRTRSSNRSEAARPHSVARSAAASQFVWSDLPSSRSRVLPSTSVAQRANKRAQRSVSTPRVKINAPSRGVSFGAWSLPSSLLSPRASTALTCARRGIRREVLFAVKGTGAGSHARKRHYSNRRCK